MKNATGKECKTKTLQRVRVQHEMVQYIKRVQHEKKCNMKSLLQKKLQYRNDVVCKKCGKKRVQHKKI